MNKKIFLHFGVLIWLLQNNSALDQILLTLLSNCLRKGGFVSQRLSTFLIEFGIEDFPKLIKLY